MDGTDHMNSTAERGLKVEHSAWQGWFEVLDESDSLASK